MSELWTRRESNCLFKNYRLGQSKFTFFYQLHKVGVCSFSRAEYANRVEFLGIGIGQVDI